MIELVCATDPGFKSLCDLLCYTAFLLRKGENKQKKPPRLAACFKKVRKQRVAKKETAKEREIEGESEKEEGRESDKEGEVENIHIEYFSAEN